MKPVIISTWSFGKRGNDAAWPALSRAGSSLDAVERACVVVETDAEVDSVGFGGLPDSSGHLSLDGCIMLSPSQCGSVCNVKRFMHPVSIARHVMEKTPHVMLAGDGADAFAETEGFLPADLLSADAQDRYTKWKRDRQLVDQSKDGNYDPPRPIDVAQGGKLFFHPDPRPPKHELAESKWSGHDTIGVLALDSLGTLAGACSTSGTPFKMPGRVGDSPIIGHGLYVDPKHGAAAATGAGELIMGVSASFLVVELMRQGLSALDALRKVIRRIAETYELRDSDQVAMIAMQPDGTTASAALRSGYLTSITDSSGSRVVEPDSVLIAD